MLHRFFHQSFQDIDLTGLYAYTDSSHARSRELWRGFLCAILPSILMHDGEMVEKILSDSMTTKVEDLCENNPVRMISFHIAKAINVPVEFALAAFYEHEYCSHMSTKLYKINYKPLKKKTMIAREDTMISDWLRHFSKIYSEKEFVELMESLKFELK